VVLSDHIREDVMGGARSTHSDEKCIYGSRRERKIRMDIRQIHLEDVNWIQLAQDRDEWWALVNMIMKLRVPENVGKFLIN
jgi:hypothetical protein